MTEKEKPSQL